MGDPVAFCRQVRQLVDSPASGTRYAIRFSARANAIERVSFLPETGEFAVEYLNGTQAGAVKTYYIRKGDSMARRNCFTRETRGCTILFAIKFTDGPQAGAVKSYYVPEGDALTRVRYFTGEAKGNPILTRQ